MYIAEFRGLSIDLVIHADKFIDSRCADKFHASHAGRYDIRNVIEPDSVLQKRSYGSFIGSIHRTRDVAAASYRLERKRETRELVHVRLFERQAAEFSEIQLLVVQRKPLRKAQRILYRLPHVRVPHLRNYRSVSEFHH